MTHAIPREMIVEEAIRKYTLQNAVLHGGKAEKGAVLGRLINEMPELKPEIKSIMLKIEKALSEVNSLSPETQKAELERLAPELLVREKKEKSTALPDLPNAQLGKVVMRLAPYPSGPLHIGNARMVILNDEYVKRYNGRLLLIFDDTIGSDEKTIVPDAYDMIKDSLRWLGVEYDTVYYKSDRLDLFYDWAERIIKTGGAYVCSCLAEELRNNRANGIECIHRNHSIEENIADWRDMLSGKIAEGDAILRIKTDMKHKNPAFRDRALFRIREREHPRVGRKYRVWPMLEFSWAIDDHLLGMTHIVRGKDLIIEDEMERHIWNLLGIKGAEFVHYGMLRIRESKLSKSKSMAEVVSGAFTGWDDPRTWSLQSLAKRGICPEATRKFILQFGVSLSDIEVPAENLYSENRKLIDAEANRYYFVPEPIWLKLEGLPRDMSPVEAMNHPEQPEKGKRKLIIGNEIAIPKDDFEKFSGKDIRLKDFCNVRLGKVTEFLSREIIDLPKVQWVERKSGINVSIIMEDGSRMDGVGEADIQKLHPRDVVQFERFAFVRIETVTRDVVTAFFAHK